MDEPTRTFSHRMPPRLTDRVDAYATAHGISRAAAINVLCTITLATWETAQKPGRHHDTDTVRAGRPRPVPTRKD